MDLAGYTGIPIKGKNSILLRTCCNHLFKVICCPRIPKYSLFELIKKNSQTQIHKNMITDEKEINKVIIAFLPL